MDLFVLLMKPFVFLFYLKYKFTCETKLVFTVGFAFQTRAQQKVYRDLMAQDSSQQLPYQGRP